MSYINFDKSVLHDLNLSKQKEFILVSSTGAYCSSSVILCNTRKYHGLLVAPPNDETEDRFVLLSSLDETIFINDDAIQLANHQYPGVHYPEGYSTLQSFQYETNPFWIYNYEDVLLEKEIMFCKNESRVIIRYNVLEAKNPFRIRFNPLVANRNIHSLRKESLNEKIKSDLTNNGADLKWNDTLNLSLQFSKKTELVLSPDWYFNHEYFREKERGYDYSESLFSPGYFEMKLKKGDEIFFTASTVPMSARSIKRKFSYEKEIISEKFDFDSCLLSAADQFVVNNNDRFEIIAGWPWFGSWGRDTFIALPGIALPKGNAMLFHEVLKSSVTKLKDGLFPNMGNAYNSVDAPLWFFYSIQNYLLLENDRKKVWKEFGPYMKSILENYKSGTLFNIHMDDSGLIWAGEEGKALTWMDAVNNGHAVTPRSGYAVEINALWYNAVMFSLELAFESDDKSFYNEWEKVPSLIKKSFIDLFWSDEKKYLADYVDENHTDWSIRPNQVIAASLPFSPVDQEKLVTILEIATDHLLTDRGLRTLSQDHPEYKGIYSGNHVERDNAYHQGTVWPWLLGPYVDLHYKVYGNERMDFIHALYEEFESTVFEYGLGSVAEIYDGDSPHNPNGTISQAWSVAELLRIKFMIDNSGFSERRSKISFMSEAQL